MKIIKVVHTGDNDLQTEKQRFLLQSYDIDMFLEKFESHIEEYAMTAAYKTILPSAKK
jgi:hypothetical protein